MNHRAGRRRPGIRIVAVVLAALALCAGCSSHHPAAGTSLRGMSFTVLAQWTGAEQAALQSVIDAFDQQTGAVGTYLPAKGGDVDSTLGISLNGGTAPDVAVLSSIGAFQQYVSTGMLTAGSAQLLATVHANFAAEWATLGSAGGTLYGVPVDAADDSTIWYDVAAFQHAGITAVPTTWADLIKDGHALHDAGVPAPIAVAGGDGWTLTDWFENVYLSTAGVDRYDQLTRHQIPWTDPSVTTALNALEQIWGDPSLVGDAADVLKVDFTASVDNVFSSSPTSAMVYGASFVPAAIATTAPTTVAGSGAQFFAVPATAGVPPALEATGDYAVQFGRNRAAAAFLQFLAGAQAARLLVSSPGSDFLSANKQLPNSVYPNPRSAALAQLLVDAGDNVRFDMSDQAPAEFGGTPGKGEWGDLSTFLSDGDVAGAQAKLEADASAAHPWPTSPAG